MTKSVVETISDLIKGEPLDIPIEELIFENPRLFKFVNNPSLGLQVLAIKMLGSNIKYIEDQKPMLQKIAIDEDIENIKYISKPSQDIEEFVIKDYPEAISYINQPRDFSILTACNYPALFKDIKIKTPYMCEYAVKKNPENIEFIDNPSIELQRIAYMANPNLLSKVSSPDSGLIMEIIPNNPLIVKDVNSSMVHYKMAIRYDPSVILQLSDELIKELLPYTISVVSQMIEDAESFTDKDVIMFPMSILALGFHKRYKEFIEIAFDEEPELIKLLPHEVSDEKLPYILSNYGWFLKYLEEEKKTDMNIMLALSNGQEWAIEYVNNPSVIIQRYAVEENVNSLRFIKNPDPSIVDIAISKSPFIIRYIDNASDFICNKAIRKDACSIQFIKNQTEKMQYIAIRANPMSAKYFKNPSTVIKVLAADLYPDAMDMEQFKITLDDLKNMSASEIEKMIVYADVNVVKEYLKLK